MKCRWKYRIAAIFYGKRPSSAKEFFSAKFVDLLPANISGNLFPGPKPPIKTAITYYRDASSEESRWVIFENEIMGTPVDICV